MRTMHWGSDMASQPPPPLKYAGQQVLDGFNRVAEALHAAGELVPRLAEETILDRVTAEKQRFQLWAANLGLYSNGDRALDYRLQDSALTKDYALGLLQELVACLKNALALIDEQRDGQEHPMNNLATGPQGLELGFGDIAIPNVDQSESEDSDESDLSDDSLFSHEMGATEQSWSAFTAAEYLTPGSRQSKISIAYEDIVDIVDRLCRLAADIRLTSCRTIPSSRNFYRDRISDGKGGFIFLTNSERDMARRKNEEHHTQWIGDVVRHLERTKLLQPNPVLDDSYVPQLEKLDNQTELLVRRIGRANAYRQQQFSFWKSRHEERMRGVQEAEEVPKDHVKREIQVSRSTAQSIRHHKPRQIIGYLSNESHTWRPRSNLIPELKAPSIISTIIQEPTVIEPGADKVQWPPFPQDLGGSKKDFVCPYCFSPCPAKYRNKKTWRDHLIHDLQPYTCTYPDCEIGDKKLLNSWEEWIDHERTCHRTRYVCHSHSSANFPDESSYVKHFQEEHDSTPGDKDWKEASTQITTPDRTCPICKSKAENIRDMENHLSSHLVSFALRSLPQLIGDDHDPDGTEASGSAVAMPDSEGPGERGSKADSEPNPHPIGLQKSAETEGGQSGSHTLTETLLDRLGESYGPIDHYIISLREPSVCLSQVLASGALVDSDVKRKFHLSYLLAKLIWQFCDSGWITDSWSKHHIHFKQLRGKDTMQLAHQPLFSFSALSLGTETPKNTMASPSMYRIVLTLGITLLEIEIGKSIEDLYQPENIAIGSERRIEQPPYRKAWNYIRSKEWRDRKSTFRPIRDSIEICLNPLSDKLVGEGSQISQNLYEIIVRPLEHHFHLLWGYPVDEIHTEPLGFQPLSTPCEHCWAPSGSPIASIASEASHIPGPPSEDGELLADEDSDTPDIK